MRNARETSVNPVRNLSRGRTATRETAPALKRFAQEALYACRQRGYRLLTGAGMTGTGSKSAVRFEVVRKCATAAAQSEGV